MSSTVAAVFLAMALAWQLLTGVVLFLLAILSGSEVQGTNFVSIALQ